MFNSTVLDVAIGVVFAFLAISLVTSAIVEALSTLLSKRASNLLQGIQTIVNDPEFTGLAKSLYKHALINPRGEGEIKKGNLTDPNAKRDAYPRANLPAYIDKQQFAAALLDITGLSTTSATNPAAQAPGPAAVAAFLQTLETNVNEIGSPQIKQLLDGIVQRTKGDLEKIQSELAEWFDSAMDRVGGAFKRWTQMISFVVALLAAAVLNVNAIHVATTLWKQPTLVDELKLPVADAGGTAQMPAARDILDTLFTNLPVGWPPGEYMQVQDPDPNNKNGWVSMWSRQNLATPIVFGWLITAFATLFGAPFWFDVLQSFVRLKGSGPSPEEKLKGQAAAN